jgi:predicted NBD/HSP70 family sugar kinase
MSREAEGEPVLVAVDFTAEALRVMLADLEGRPLARETWVLPPVTDEDGWSWEIGGRISTVFASEGARRSALGIAVACPGSVDEAAGRIRHSTARPEWDGMAVVDALRRHIDAPIVALNRLHAAVQAEAAHGAAADSNHVLYVSLRGVPAAAMLAGGRIVRGAGGEAGSLPALPPLRPGEEVAEDALEAMTGVLADATALLDPEVVIIEAEEAHAAAVVPLLQRVVDEVAPGPRVVRAELGEDGALVGAVRAAAVVAFEGERRA